MTHVAFVLLALAAGPALAADATFNVRVLTPETAGIAAIREDLEL